MKNALKSTLSIVCPLAVGMGAYFLACPTAGAQAPAAPAQPSKKEVRMTPDGKWPVHSMERPRPEGVPPQYDGRRVPVPKGAELLFDGKSLENWKSRKLDPSKNSDAAGWTVVAGEEGYFEVVPKTGPIQTRGVIVGDGHLHIEWATPSEVVGKGQGRGNSGVFIGGYPEVQVLDSFENDTYPDGQAAALYGMYPPRVNASRKPGEWQAYDIVIERAKERDGKVEHRQRISVWHNGVLVQDGVELDGKQQEGALELQDHGNPMRFRNIWFLPMGSASGAK